MVGIVQMKIMLINVFIQVIGFVFLLCGFVIGNGIIFVSILLQFFYCLNLLYRKRNVNIDYKRNVDIEEKAIPELTVRYFSEIEELVVNEIIDSQNSIEMFLKWKEDEHIKES